MTTDIGHERCSELLLRYERGQLSAPEADAVERHLGTCSRCSQERAGLVVLIDADMEALSMSERARLHAALAEEMRRPREPEARVARPLPGPSLWSRITSGGAGRLVGVAATLLLLVGALVFGPRLVRGNGVQDAASGGAGGEVEVERGPDPVFAAPDVPSAPEAIPEAGQAQDRPDQAEEAIRAQPASPDELDSIQKLGAFASTSRPFTTFATAFGAEDIVALRDSYVDKLAQKAGRALETLSLDPSPSEVIRTCAQLAMQESPNPLLPAYATYAPVEGIESLVLGFVYSEDGEGPVDRYTVLAWPGADCDAAPTFVSGVIAAPK